MINCQNKKSRFHTHTHDTRRGIYLLICELRRNSEILVGRLGKFSLKKGFYIYVGSAMNGLEQRVARHLRKDKKMHWHIDYLLKKAKILEVVSFQTSYSNDECLTASNIAKLADDEPVKSFGSSDCKCNTHLFYFDKCDKTLLKKLTMILD